MKANPFSHLWMLSSGQIQRSNRPCCRTHSTELMSATDVKPRTRGRYSGYSGRCGGGEEPDEPSGSQLILTDSVSAAGRRRRSPSTSTTGRRLRPIVISCDCRVSQIIAGESLAIVLEVKLQINPGNIPLTLIQTQNILIPTGTLREKYLRNRNIFTRRGLITYLLTLI